MWYHLYVESKNDTSECVFKWMCIQNKNRLTDIEKLIVTKVEGRGDKLVWDWQIQTTIYKIDKQQGFTYSTENYTQHFVAQT